MTSQNTRNVKSTQVDDGVQQDNWIGNKFPNAVSDDKRLGTKELALLYFRAAQGKNFVLNDRAVEKHLGIKRREFYRILKVLVRFGYIKRRQNRNKRGKTRGRWEYASETLNLNACPKGGRSGYGYTDLTFIKAKLAVLDPDLFGLAVYLRSHKFDYRCPAKQVADRFGVCTRTAIRWLNKLIAAEAAVSFEMRDPATGEYQGVCYSADKGYSEHFGEQKVLAEVRWRMTEKPANIGPFSDLPRVQIRHAASRHAVNCHTHCRINSTSNYKTRVNTRSCAVSDETAPPKEKPRFSKWTKKPFTEKQRTEAIVDEYLETHGPQQQTPPPADEVRDCFGYVDMDFDDGLETDVLDHLRDELPDELILRAVLEASRNRLGMPLRTPASMEAVRVMVASQVLDLTDTAEAFDRILGTVQSRIGDKPGPDNWFNRWGVISKALIGYGYDGRALPDEWPHCIEQCFDLGDFLSDKLFTAQEMPNMRRLALAYGPDAIDDIIGILGCEAEQGRKPGTITSWDYFSEPLRQLAEEEQEAAA